MTACPSFCHFFQKLPCLSLLLGFKVKTKWQLSTIVIQSFQGRRWITGQHNRSYTAHLYLNRTPFAEKQRHSESVDCLFLCPLVQDSPCSSCHLTSSAFELFSWHFTATKLKPLKAQWTPMIMATVQCSSKKPWVLAFTSECSLVQKALPNIVPDKVNPLIAKALLDPRIGMSIGPALHFSLPCSSASSWAARNVLLEDQSHQGVLGLQGGLGRWSVSSGINTDFKIEGLEAGYFNVMGVSHFKSMEINLDGPTKQWALTKEIRFCVPCETKSKQWLVLITYCPTS